MSRVPSIDTPRAWARLVIATAAVFAVFHVLAGELGSVRGELGIAVGAVVVGGVLVADRWLSGNIEVVRGALGAPQGRGLVAAGAVAVLLLAVLPVVAWLGGGRLVVYPGWGLLVPGLFAQGGIAEELLFRGFLFAHLRRGRSFWRAAALSMLPFVAVHGLLFATLPWPIAAASVGLAAVTSFPLAHAFELGGRTVWGPAIVHAMIQGAIKLIVVDGALAPTAPLIWMAASAVLPFLMFLVRRPAEAESAAVRAGSATAAR